MLVVDTSSGLSRDTMQTSGGRRSRDLICFPAGELLRGSAGSGTRHCRFAGWMWSDYDLSLQPSGGDRTARMMWVDHSF